VIIVVVAIVIAIVVLMTIEFCGVSWLCPLSENLFSPQVRFCKASFFSEPLKYVTQFLSTLLANSAKYPNARSCAKFHSKFLFLTLNTLSRVATRDW